MQLFRIRMKMRIGFEHYLMYVDSCYWFEERVERDLVEFRLELIRILKIEINEFHWMKQLLLTEQVKYRKIERLIVELRLIR